MSEILVARRYARALFKICDSEDQHLNLAKQSMDCLSELFTDESICKVLKSPNMPRDLKLQILEHVVSSCQPSKDIQNFLKVTVEAGRIRVFEHLNHVFGKLLNESRGIVEATVHSVVSLSQEEIREVQDKVEGLTGKKVKLTNLLDPELLGGLVIKIGNKIIDISLRNRLNRVARYAIVSGE